MRYHLTNLFRAYKAADINFRTHAIGYTKKPEIAYIPNLKHWYAYQMVYPLSLALVKASFLALYYRIFPPPIINRYLFWGVGAFIAVYTVIIIFVNVGHIIARFLYPIADTARLSSVQTLRTHGRLPSPGIALNVTMFRLCTILWPASTS